MPVPDVIDTVLVPGEPARIDDLRRHGILDTDPERAYDDLASLAAQLCGTPMALVSLVDVDRQWFKSRVGVDVCSTPREVSFCAHALTGPGLLVVPDTRADDRFADNPLVTGAPGIRFYAGAPLTTEGGYTLGTLCVLDVVPRTLTPLQLDQLRALGRQVVGQLVLRRRTIELAEQRQWLAESEGRWRALVEHSPVAVAVIDGAGLFAYANPRAAELYGTADLVGKVARDFIPPEAMADSVALFGRILAGESVLGTRWELQRADGTRVDVEINAAPVEYRGRWSVQVELRDMSAQARAEKAQRESERRWRALFSGSPVGIGLLDEHGRFVHANEALCRLLGREEDDVIGRSDTVFTHPDDLDGAEPVGAVMDSGRDEVASSEKRYLRPDGGIVWAWLTVTHTEGPAGETWTLAHIQDLTARKANEEAILQSKTDFDAVATVARRIQTGADARQSIVDAGRRLGEAAYALLLEPDAERGVLLVTASTNRDLIDTPVLLDASAAGDVFRTGLPLFVPDPADNPRVSTDLLELTGARSFYIVPVQAAEQVIAVLVVAWSHRVPDLDDRRAGIVDLLADQAAAALRQARLVADLTSLAVTDPLTGLANRRRWDEVLSESLEVARRGSTPLTVAMADLDHFKRFNDSYGHPAGDELLRRVGSALRTVLRRNDLAVRWGGEEFAIVLPDCPRSEAERVLARVLHAVPEHQTFSIGVATWDGREPADALMERADRALYLAKSGGRNRIVAV